MENQSMPLAPSRIYPRSDDQESATKRPNPGRHERRSNKCFVYLFAAVVILSTFALVFALVVMKPRNPDVKLTSPVTVKNLRHGFAATTGAYLNVTLVTEVTIRNTNFGEFKYEKTTGSVLYGDVVVGDMKISNGSVRARKTKRFNVTVDVRSNRLSDTKNLSVDMNSGMVNFTSFAMLKGRVHLLDIVKKKRTAELNCSMSLDLSRQSIIGLLCN